MEGAGCGTAGVAAPAAVRAIPPVRASLDGVLTLLRYPRYCSVIRHAVSAWPGGSRQLINTMTRPFVSVMGLVALCAAGLLVAAQHTGPESSSTLPAFQNVPVTVRTDASEYRNGDTLNVAVENGRARSVWFLRMERGGRNPWWSLQRWEGGSWADIDVWKPTNGECRIVVSEPDASENLTRELAPGASLSDTWTLQNCTVTSPVGPMIELRRLQTGTYRVLFRYGSERITPREHVAYSAEFRVLAR